MSEEKTEPTFAQLGLGPALTETLAALGYEAPTPIQQATIPALLAGRDLIGQAQTGTGKTAAFALPILHHIDPAAKEPQALILAPTRELAMQVAEAIHSYSRGANISVVPIYGGAPISLQIRHLQRGAQIIVGTPGRLLDHLDRGTLKMATVRLLVLDEADEMLKMGFIDDVERILSAAATPRQIALFSATMPEEIRRIAARHLVNPERVAIEQTTVTAPAIEQRVLNLAEGQKLEVLTQLLELEPHEGTLIFKRTKNGAAELAEKLEARGFAAVAMHGDMTQSLREGVIRRLRAGQVEIVVATDVAARGLDVEQITHVVNYDVPYSAESYVHRIGRTGRAGRSGVATLFITARERRMMREIERFIGSTIKPMKMPTNADVAARRVSLLKDTLRKVIEAGELDHYVAVVEQLAEEGPFDITDIAAAAAKLAASARPADGVGDALAPRADDRPERPERSERAEPQRSFARPDRGDSAGSEDRAPRAPRVPRESDEPKVRLSMAVGKKDGIRPADIVGSIANEADVPGRDIGPIEIRDSITFVYIPERFQDQVLKKVGGKKFRGTPLNVRVHEGAEGEPERAPRTFKPRADREDSPRSGSFKAAEKRTFKPREDFVPRKGAAPKREFKPREDGDAPAPRTYKPAADDADSSANPTSPKKMFGKRPTTTASADREEYPRRKTAYESESPSYPRRKTAYESKDTGSYPRRKPDPDAKSYDRPKRATTGAPRTAARPSTYGSTAGYGGAARKPSATSSRPSAGGYGAKPRAGGKTGGSFSSRPSAGGFKPRGGKPAGGPKGKKR